MKNFRISFYLLSSLALAACTNTMSGIGQDVRGPGDDRPPPMKSAAWAGVKKDWGEFGDWVHSRPSSWDKTMGRMPSGYTGKPQGPGTEQPTGDWRLPGMDTVAPAISDENLPADDMSGGKQAWEDLGEIQTSPAARATAPMALTGKQAGRINYDDISVYPVDNDREPYDDYQYDFNQTASESIAAGAEPLPQLEPKKLPVSTKHHKRHKASRHAVKKAVAAPVDPVEQEDAAPDITSTQ